jgi:hypothetical protein
MAHDTVYAVALNLFIFSFWTQKRFPISFHSQYNFPSFIAAPIEVWEDASLQCASANKSFGDYNAVMQTNVVQACFNFKTMQPSTSISFKS